MKNTPTGGGPMENKEWWVDTVLNIVGDDNCVVTGINPNGTGDSYYILEPDYNDHQARLAVIPVDMTEEKENEEIFIMTPFPVDSANCSTASSSSTARSTVNSSKECTAGSSIATMSTGENSAAALASSNDTVNRLSTGGNSVVTLASSNGKVNRLSQLKQKRKQQLNEDSKQESTKIAKDRKTIALVDAEMDKLSKEQALYETELSLRKIEHTNAKLLYEIQKLEREQGISPGQGVQNLIQLDIDLPVTLTQSTEHQ